MAQLKDKAAHQSWDPSKMGSRVSTYSTTTLICTILWVLDAINASDKTRTLCISNNPLMEMLSKSKVQIFSEPVPNTSSSCTAEWDTHRTCCDSKSLIQYAEHDIRMLNYSFFSVHANIGELTIFAETRKAEAIPLIKAKKGSAGVLQFELAYNNFRHMCDQFNIDDVGLAAEKQKCFQRIKTIRTSGLCYTCSGRSSYFFLKGHPLMDMADCTKTIKDCLTTWKHSLDLLRIISAAKTLRTHLQAVNSSSLFLNFSDEHVTRIQDWIGSQNIQEPILACKDQSQCSKANSKLLCKTFISLGRKDTTSSLSRLVRETVNSEQSGHFGRAGSNHWAIGGKRLLEVDSTLAAGNFDIGNDPEHGNMFPSEDPTIQPGCTLTATQASRNR